MKQALVLQQDKYAICRLNEDAPLPENIRESVFYSVTRTQDELSVVVKQDILSGSELKRSSDWRMLKVEGPLEFSMVGVIADIATVLQTAHVSIFVISTYNTDYILLKNSHLDRAVTALRAADYEIIESG